MAYLNTLEKSKMYLDSILELFNRTSLTAPLDTASQQYDWMGADELKVLMIETNGLGDYQKDVGYPQGSIDAKWETMKLATDRGVKFLLDRVDNDEVLALTMGRVAEDFTKYRMVPELDAYRFAKYANGAGQTVAGTLNGSSEFVLTAFDRARVHLNSKDVPTDGRMLFVNQDLEFVLNAELNRRWSNDKEINTEIKSYNGMQIVYVPNNRFQTMIQLNAGGAEWGYKADPASKDINFMLIYPKSVVQAAKVANGKFISADDPGNEVDSHKFLFRIFHDAFVIDPLKDGVYVHTK